MGAGSLKEPHHSVRLLQARQESNLQPPVLQRTPSDADVEAFVDFQRLSSERATPASLDNAGVGTNPGTGRSSPVHPMSEHFVAASNQLARPHLAVRAGRAAEDDAT